MAAQFKGTAGDAKATIWLLIASSRTHSVGVVRKLDIWSEYVKPFKTF
jgi:hypothetical protein